MSIDINLFRKEKGGDPDLIKDSEKKRFKNPLVVDEIIEQDEKFRKEIFKLEQLKKRRNQVQESIQAKKVESKGQDPCTEELKEKDSLDQEIKQQQGIQDESEKMLAKLMKPVGNILHESVPVSKDENDNVVVATWGKIPDIKVDGVTLGQLHHHQIMSMIEGYEPQRGAKIAGHRGYFLKGVGCMLNMAIYQYGMKFLQSKNYEPIQPPYFMKKEVVAETCQLSDFDEVLYSVQGGKNNDFYLIATSEQPISALYRNEKLEPSQLPMKFAGFSSCFRKEAGSYGKDQWGIFRIHQFEKVEQFIITDPASSWKAHEELSKTAEEFYQSLKLPYRVVNIVSGEMNDAAAKKYDLEAWFPGYDRYRELCSCSNCTDYQSRGLNIRYNVPGSTLQQKTYVHMLNATLTASERTMCCILENYQTPEGVVVPDVLQPYLGLSFIPYKTKVVPKLETNQTQN